MYLHEVQSLENNFNVVCFEGKVKVNYKNKEIFLTKGMRVNFENGIEKNSYTKEEILEFYVNSQWLGYDGNINYNNIE